MSVSVIIPYYNDYDVLTTVFPHIFEGVPRNGGEIIIIDNGSFKPLSIFGRPKIRVVRNSRNIGVGGAFNQGAELARCDRLVFMGPDVIPQEGWYHRVNRTLEKSPKTIFSCTSTDWSPSERPFRSDALRRYGAEILLKMDREDLPEGHPDRKFKNFHRILQAKWNDRMVANEVGRVQCMLGAFYWMWKDDFQKLHGWNGHIAWGSLEPFLAIKARAHGMKILVDRKLEAAHYFNRPVIRGSRADLQYYNQIFMAKTMFHEDLEEELLHYLEFGNSEARLGRLNVNQANRLISRNTGLIRSERDYNRAHFRRGLINNWDYFKTEMI